MKKLSIIFTLLCLTLSITSMAQSPLDQSLTSSGGLTIQYPAGYIGEANEDLAIGLLNLEQGIFMIIGVDTSSYSFTGEEADTSEALKDGFVSTVNLLGGGIDDSAVESMQMNDRPAFLIPFDASSIGLGYFLSFELSDGTPASAMIIAAGGTELPSGLVDDLKAIAASATLDRSLATTEEPADVTDITATDATDIVEDLTEDLETESIPEGAIPVADFPEGMILTGTGLQMTTLEGFNLIPGTEYIESSVGLISSNFQNTVILVDMGEMAEDDRNSYIEGVMPMVALMSGNENFNVETDMQEMDVDGRTITYYVSPDLTPDEEDDELKLYYFIIDLIPGGNRLATVQTMIIGGSDLINTFDEAKLMDFVESVELTEDAIAEMNAPQVLECGTSSSSVVDEAHTSAKVTCPATCNAESGSIWGTETYTDDSSICVAALHMGLIDEAGGDLVVSYAKGQDAYISSEQNGILSSEYDSWGASFTVSALADE